MIFTELFLFACIFGALSGPIEGQQRSQPPRLYTSEKGSARFDLSGNVLTADAPLRMFPDPRLHLSVHGAPVGRDISALVAENSIKEIVHQAAAPAQENPSRTPPRPFSADRFRAHVAYLASDELAGRAVGSPGSAKALDYLVRHLKEYGAKGLMEDGSWFQPFPIQGTQRGTIIGRNLVGIVPGRGDLAAEAIIVSCHHDHLGTDEALIKAGKDGIFNGADDNASGCAALLLLAEALHADKDHLPASRRSVIFASFDAEEMFLVGSRYYVNHPLWPLARTAANLNFDMVGRLNRGKLLAMDSESSHFMVERLKVLAADCGVRIETRLHGGGRSDHLNFLDRQIAAVHFNTGMHSDYHQVTDELSRIDAEGGARVSWLAYRLLRELTATPGRIQYHRPPPTFDIGRVIQFVVRFGVIPEMNTQPGKYALVQLVVPNSIAARNGLAAGDEITGMNGKEFQSLADAGIAFAELRLEKGLKLTVRRKGKTIQIDIPQEIFKDFLGPARKRLEKGEVELLFRYRPPTKVKSVALVGSFNQWKAQPMEGPDKEGYYRLRLVLKNGYYEYKFVIDDTRRVSDPLNYRVAGPEENSVLALDQQP